MHESNLAESVLQVLRDRPGPYRHIRVVVGDAAASLDSLTERLRSFLVTADPPVRFSTIEVAMRPRERQCSRCTAGWTSRQYTPSCPACGGPPLPLAHDGRLEVELD